MNLDYYHPYFPNSSIAVVLDSFNTNVYFAVTIWVNSLFAVDSSNISKTKFEIVYDLICESDGSTIDRGSITAYNSVIEEEQQSFLSKQDLSEGINCSSSWDYQFIPNNHTLFFKISLQGAGKC